MYDNSMNKGADISRLIRQRRKAAGLSLTQAARKAGTSAASLSRYENGWQRFEVYTLRKIARALGCRLSISLEPVPALRRARASRRAATKEIRRLFWDHRLQTADFRQHPIWVVERVLDYGTLADVETLISIMGREEFLNAAQNARLGSARTAEFWRAILEMEGRACTRKFSREAAKTCWTN
jgi:transcriptional regulator with XRE-family HTH domain